MDTKMIRTDILQRKDDILRWIEEKQSFAYMCRQLNCKHETLKGYLQKLNINYTGNQGAKGHKVSQKYINATDYINKDYIKSSRLRDKLIKDGIKEERCERCGLSEWLGYKIPLELHHKNGNHYDNDFCNLEILCPNCHALENPNGKTSIIEN